MLEINNLQSVEASNLISDNIELIDAVAYTDITDDAELNVHNIRSIESKILKSKQRILYDKNDKIIDYEFKPDEYNYDELKISCDITNYEKNKRLSDPLEYNVNINHYVLLNKYNKFDNCRELCDIMMMQGNIRNLLDGKLGTKLYYNSDLLYTQEISEMYYNEESNRYINKIETRSMKNKREDLEYQQLLESLKFRPNKKYLFEINEGDIFKENQNPLQVIYNLQHREYKNLFAYILNEEVNDLGFNDKEYLGLLKDGQI